MRLELVFEETLLVGMQKIQVLENSLAVSQKCKHTGIIRPFLDTHSNKHIRPYNNMCMHIHSSIIPNSQESKQPKCPTFDEQIYKMWSIQWNITWPYQGMKDGHL